MKRFLLCGIALLVLTLALLAFPGSGTVIQGSAGNTVTLAWDANS